MRGWCRPRTQDGWGSGKASGKFRLRALIEPKRTPHRSRMPKRQGLRPANSSGAGGPRRPPPPPEKARMRAPGLLQAGQQAQTRAPSGHRCATVGAAFLLPAFVFPTVCASTTAQPRVPTPWKAAHPAHFTVPSPSQAPGQPWSLHVELRALARFRPSFPCSTKRRMDGSKSKKTGTDKGPPWPRLGPTSVKRASIFMQNTVLDLPQ